MNIIATWYGTAALHLVVDGRLGVFFDPWFARPPEAMPRIVVDPDSVDLHPLSAIFVSHGHFDHILNLPQLVQRYPSAHAYVPAPALQTCRRLCRGAILKDYSCELSEGDWSRIHTMTGGDGCELSTADGSVRISATAIRSSHVKFDAWSVLRALFNSRFIRGIRYYAKLLFGFPAREVLGWALQMESSGELRQIVFFGSLCPELPRALAQYRGCDCLFIPLAGRRNILPYARVLTSALQPGTVVPLHHDDFFPPFSYAVDFQNYRQWVSATFPETRFLELQPERPTPLF